MNWKGPQIRVTFALILWVFSINVYATNWILTGISTTFSGAQALYTAYFGTTYKLQHNWDDTGYTCPTGVPAYTLYSPYEADPPGFHAFLDCETSCSAMTPVGELQDDGSGNCVCSDNSTPIGGVCPTPPPDVCPQGEQFHWQDTTIPENMSFCHDGCEYILPPQTSNPDTSGGIINIGNGIYSGTASGSGSECTPSPTYSDPPPTNNQCVIDDGGNAICFDQDPNCSVYNGVQYCVPDIPDSGCVYNEKGFICVSGSTPPPNTEGTTPEKTGTIAGDKGTGSGVQQGDVYNQDTTNNTIYNGGGGGGGCGGPGEAPCKIDESGTPDAVAEDYFTGKLTTWDDFKDAIASPENVGSGDGAWGDFDPFGWMASSSCQNLTFNFMGHQTTFPGADGCNRFEKLKSLLGWALYILTGLSLFEIATRRPE